MEGRSDQGGQPAQAVAVLREVAHLLEHRRARDVVHAPGDHPSRLAAGMGVDRRTVSSPTFILIQEYEGRLPIYHLDTYRLGSVEEFVENLRLIVSSK